MAKFKIYGALAATLLMAIIIAQNTAAVETKILFMTLTMPRAALLAVTLLIGVAIGIAATLHWGRQRQKSDSTEPPKMP
jgi:lipopolysaccharide assembly protein A